MLASMVDKVIRVMGSHQVALWLGLNLLDLVLSVISFNYTAYEANPLLRWLHNEHGVSGYALYKLGMAVFVLLLLAGIKKLKLLLWLNIGLGCLCLYITVMLIKTFS